MEPASSIETIRTAEQMRERASAIVGQEFVRAASPDDCVAGVQPKFVVSPGNEREVAAVLGCANDAGLAVIPRGGGTKLDWGNPPKRADLVLSTARLSQILEYAWADLTVSVEAGCTLRSLQNVLGEMRQRLAVDALWPEQATIGGVLSTNDSGALRLRFGALRDLIIGVTLALPDGTVASSGGKVVKNVAGYDLPKIATGALGTLGVITRAVFRLHPVCSHSLTVSFGAADMCEMQKRILAIQDSKLAHVALQIRCESGAAPVSDVLFEATEGGLLAQRGQLREIAGPLRDEDARIWTSRQALCSGRTAHTVVLKVGVLPADIAKTVGFVEKRSAAAGAKWRAVFQATGLGWLRLDGRGSELRRCVQDLRASLESEGGSVFLAHGSKELEPLDVWGGVGDALPVMRSLKQQLDPRGTLNPGRFVGGI